MLTITLLKVTHSGRAEAKKLHPFIESCDVFAPENSYCTLAEAVDAEREWQQDLKSGKSRAQMKEVIAGRYHTLKSDERYYLETVWNSLYQFRRPVFFLERFVPDVSHRLEERKTEANTLSESALDELALGRVDDYLRMDWQALQIANDVNAARDREMARNLEHEEAELRRKYSPLPANIKLTGLVGSVHTPERHMTLSVTPVDLRGTNHTIITDMGDARLRGLPFEEARVYQLRCGALELFHHGLLPVPLADIEQMDFPHLVDVLSKCPYK